MKLEIRNGFIVQCVNLLDKLKLKGMDSIYRTRINRELLENLERIKKEDVEIRKEFCETDENGELVVKDDKYIVNDEQGLISALNELYNDRLVIEGSNYKSALKSIKKSLEEADIELEGEDAYTFEYLYTAISE